MSRPPKTSRLTFPYVQVLSTILPWAFVFLKSVFPTAQVILLTGSQPVSLPIFVKALLLKWNS